MAQTAERIVYQTSKRKPKGSVVRYTMHGIRHRQITIGGKYRTQVQLSHLWVTILNHELPQSRADPGQYIAHPQDGRCCKCGHIYSHLMTHAGQPCDECRTERMARKGEALQKIFGVNLGWQTIDHENNRRVYGYSPGKCERLGGLHHRV